MSAHPAFLDQLTAQVEANLQNEQFGVEELAEAIGMSRSNLHRKLQELNGKSVSQFIREYRLDRALEILRAEDVTASEVAFQVGFSSATYFNKCFHDYFGVTPGEARKAVAENHGSQIEPASSDRKEASRVSKKSIVLLASLVLVGLLAGYYIFNSFSQNQPDLSAEKSIAVMPFINLSGDSENQYFSDGMMEAILNHLSQVSALRVISRTTMEQYRNNDKAIPQVAKELNVTHVLEGSVQRYSNNIRLIVKLVDAKTDKPVWSRTFDREISDVFAVQSETATAIATALETELTSNERQIMESYSTTNLSAYDYYLKGLQYSVNYYTRRSAIDLELSEQFYRQSLALDPDFFDARIELLSLLLTQAPKYSIDSLVSVANTMLQQYPNRAELYTLIGNLYWSFGERGKAKENFIRALRINSNNTLALSQLGWVTAVENPGLSLILYERALRLEPLSADNLRMNGFFIALLLGEYSRSDEFYQKALDIQPDNTGIYLNWGFQYIVVGEYSKALSYYKKGLEFNPDEPRLLNDLGLVYSFQGNFEMADEAFRKSEKMRGYQLNPLRYGYVLWNLNRHEEAMNYFNQQLQEGGVHGEYDKASVHAFLGQKDEAYALFERGDVTFVPEFISRDPMVTPLRKDKRFQAYFSDLSQQFEECRQTYYRLRNEPIASILDAIDDASFKMNVTGNPTAPELLDFSR